MSVKISWITIEQGDVTDRLHAQLVRASLRKSAEKHVQVTLGKHFQDVPETQPGGEYGYTARGKKYNMQKLKKFGSRLPLVRTGKLRRYVRNNKKITATQNKATVYLRSYFPLTDQRRKELEALSAADLQFAEKTARDHYNTEAAKPENQRKRRKRI